MQSIFDNTAIPALEQVVNFAQTRHAVLASNVANIDVPGYRTRDLSPDAFQTRLREAIRARDADFSLGNPAFVVPRGDPFAEVKDSIQGILQHDDTNVGLEQQIAEITKNQLQHNLAVTIMTNQFRLLEAAISERA
jgi:flagellar basal-body rod protein FlgB